MESTYEAALVYELEKAGLSVKAQIPMPVVYETVKLNVGYRIDLLVNDLVIIEVKSVEALCDVHHMQLLTYLKLSARRLGILVNFNTSAIEKSIFRKANGL